MQECAAYPACACDYPPQPRRMTPATIRATRKRLGLTQGQAARLLGVDGRTWRRWECAERTMPKPVCRLLGAAEAVPGVLAWLETLAAAHAAAPGPEGWE